MLDLDFYRTYYPDLKDLTDSELINHYNNHGKNEDRVESQESFKLKFPNFSFSVYRNANPDLKDMSDIELLKHFINIGRFENREYQDDTLIVAPIINHNCKCPNVIGKVKTQHTKMTINPVNIVMTKHGKLLVIAGAGNDDINGHFQAILMDPYSSVVNGATGSEEITHKIVKTYDFRTNIAVQYNTTPPHPLADCIPDLQFNTDDMPPSIKGLGYDMFGSGFGVLEDCQILIVSGTEIFDIFKGSTRCAKWDPMTEEFSHAATLRKGRWYPTSTTLPSGHLFTIGGIKGTKDNGRYNSTNNTNTDIYDPYAIGYDRGDNLIDPATGTYYTDYLSSAERLDGTNDTAQKPICGLWMKHSLAQLKETKDNICINGEWQENSSATDLCRPGLFVPAEPQRFHINSNICGAREATLDNQCSYHGEGTEMNKAADGKDYDIMGAMYSPLHDDVFSPISLKNRDAFTASNGTIKMEQYASNETAEQARVDMYPRQHLLKDGNVFIAGMDKESWEYHPSINKYDNHQDSIFGRRLFGTSVLLPLHYNDLAGDGTVPYRERVFILGGIPSYNRNIPATNTTEVLDLTKFEGQSRTIPKFTINPENGEKVSPWQQWQQGPNFNDALTEAEQKGWARVEGDKGEMIQQNATILPDGTVFIQGGSRIDEVPPGRLETFVYNPKPIPGYPTGKLTRTADVKTQRHYHATSILLPDGTVGIYGGNPVRGFFERNIEIYEPAYLFDANNSRIPDSARPKIMNLDDSPDVRMSSPTKLNVLEIVLEKACQCPPGVPSCGPDCASKLLETDVITVSLCRNGAVTHASNSEQRMVTAKVSKINTATSSITVEMPVFNFDGYNENMSTAFCPCPPGCYQVYVFVNGVPSIAKIVRMVRATGFVPIGDHGTGGHGTGTGGTGTGGTGTGGTGTGGTGTGGHGDHDHAHSM